MAKKRLRRNKIQANVFAGGGMLADSQAAFGEAFKDGKSTADSLLQGTGAIGTIVNAAKDNAGIKDVSEEKAQILEQGSKVVKASTNDELMSEWGANNPVKQNYKLGDVRGGSTGQRLLNTFNATTAGASAGAKMGGPYGAIAGAAAGLGSALAGWFTGRSKAKKLAKKLNSQAEQANKFVMSSLENKAENIATQNSLNQLANFSAFGGPVDFGNGAIGFDFMNQALENKAKDTMAKQRFVSVPPSMDGKTETIDVNPFAFGGDMAVNSDFSNGVTQVNNGGTHEENPNAGVQMGVDRNGTPNLVEEGEVVYDNFVFSNRISLPQDLKKKYKLKGNTFANAAKALQKESQERPNDPISQRGLKKSMERLAMAQEQLKAEQAQKEQAAQAPVMQQGGYNPYESLEYAYGGNLFSWGAQLEGGQNPYAVGPWVNPMDQYEIPIPEIPVPPVTVSNDTYKPQYRSQYDGLLDKPALGDFRDNYPMMGNEIKIQGEPMQYSLQNVPEEYANKQNNSEESGIPKEKPTWMRYAPVAGAGLSVLSDLFSKPDYSNADAIEAAANGIQGVSFDPIGNYLSYNPMDKDFYINKMNQQGAATRRALRNSAGGNQAAANAMLLASDYNLTNSMGNLARQAEEYNQQQRERVEAFNRGTNQFNSEGKMRAQTANMQRDAMRMRGKIMAAQMREQIAQQRKANRSANLSSLFQGLGDIGSENFQSNMIDRNAGTVWKMDTKGNRYTSDGSLISNPSSRRTRRKSRKS